MAVPKMKLLESRVATLEAELARNTALVSSLETEVAQLKERVTAVSKTDKDWLDEIYGSFANDPIYDEAMELGRKYRESLRPGAKKTPRRVNKKPSRRKA